MNRIGFPKSSMKEEKRIALLPEEIKRIEHPEFLFFQEDYAAEYDYKNKEYLVSGANIISKKKTYSLEVICQPKFCEADLDHIKEKQIVFGWLHLGEDDKATYEFKKREITAIAWELMFKDGKNIFQRNGLLTGEIGVLHAIAYAGKSPKECRAAVIGRGRVGKGAFRQLEELKVPVIDVYHSENSHLLKEDIDLYDIIVHCACSDKNVLDREDLRKIKPGALFVHLGSNCIEGAPYSQSIYSPVVPFNNGKNLYYIVNHVPTLCYRTASRAISEDVAPYIDLLTKKEMDDALRNAIVVYKGKPIKERLLH